MSPMGVRDPQPKHAIASDLRKIWFMILHVAASISDSASYEITVVLVIVHTVTNKRRAC